MWISSSFSVLNKAPHLLECQFYTNLSTDRRQKNKQQDKKKMLRKILMWLMITFFTTSETASTRLRGQADISCGNVENHPCGWVRYHDGDWNSFNANDLIENTLWVQFFLLLNYLFIISCPCSSILRCRYADTDTAMDLHRFTCQPLDGTNSLFPS